MAAKSQKGYKDHIHNSYCYGSAASCSDNVSSVKKHRMSLLVTDQNLIKMLPGLLACSFIYIAF